MPLTDAAEAFAPLPLRRRVRALNIRPWPVVSDEFVQAPDWPGFNAHISKVLGNQRERSEAYQAIQEHLIEKLRKGVFEACGVRVPAKGDAKIEPLPAHLFDDNPRINWDRNTLKNFGLEFQRVRVRSRATAPLLPPAGLKKRRPGRPSREDEIERAINQALADRVDLRGMPRKQAIEQLRVSAEKLGIKTKRGFSHSVLQRVLVRRFGQRD